MIIDGLADFRPFPVFAGVKGVARHDINFYLKIEALNPSGSIKFKPAVGIVRALEKAGRLRAESTIIDTTSGNMGIALSMVARSRGYSFICVADEKMTPHNRALVKAYGSELVILPNSTLAERYAYISARLECDDRLVWTQQFTNPVNPTSHARTTAREILSDFPTLDYLFAGTGTAGTLVGCARELNRLNKAVRVIAVDVLGSHHFSDVSHPRLLPGIGASERSPFLDESQLHDVVIVDEKDTVATCYETVRKTGWLLGPSSGSVVAAVKRYGEKFEKGAVVVGIAADFGERYLDGLYDSEWVTQHHLLGHVVEEVL